MKIKFAMIVLLVFASLLVSSKSAKILGLFPTFGKSHLIVDMAVIQPLIDRGHDVTVVTTLPLNDPQPKYRHIQLDIPNTSKEFIEQTVKEAKSPNFIAGLKRVTDYAANEANASLHEPQMKKLMAEESFDLVVVGYFFNDFLIGVAAHFKCPYVMIFSNGLTRTLSAQIGNPVEPLYVPHLFSGMKQPLSFLQRLGNVIFTALDFVMFSVIDNYMKEFYDENFPADRYPSYESVQKNVSLVLINHHFSNGPIKPNVPGVVEIGGIQIKPKPDPLPDNVRKFLDGASKDGAIYFSLGTAARGTFLAPDTVKNVFNVLSSLKQRVIWKWDDDTPPGKASNILFGKWFPQDDILAHPNVKLFITHGGHGGVVEAQYHGVPMVGMPLFADQFANLESVQTAGYGITFGKEDITEEMFRNAVLEVLQNPSYREKIQEFSKIYRDRPTSARETAGFWMEYVIRHRGAKHIQTPAMHMNLIQYFGLDVAAVLLTVLYVVYRGIKWLLSSLISLIFGKKCKKELNPKNKAKKVN